MTQFLTQCPACKTSFKIADTHLDAADGLVRCGSCLEIFSAYEFKVHFNDEPITQAEETETIVAPEDESASLFTPIYDLDIGVNKGEQESSSTALFEPIFDAEEPEIDYKFYFEPEPEAEFEVKTDHYEEPSIDLSFADEELRAEEILIEEAITEEPVVEEAVVEEPIFAEAITEELVAKEPVIKDSINEELIIEEAKPDEKEIDYLSTNLVNEPFDKSAPISNKAELHQSLAQLASEDSLETLKPELIAAIDDDPLEIIHIKSARSPLMNFVLGLGFIVFSLSLLAQYIWFNLDLAIKNPRLSFLTEPICQTLVCPKATFKDLSQLYTEELVVYSHPEYENALKVDFIFSNEADFDQYFPIAELSFNDPSNRLISSRQFTPQEYLPPELENFSLMPSHSSIQISLEIIDPGQNAINYSLDFR